MDFKVLLYSFWCMMCMWKCLFRKLKYRVSLESCNVRPSYCLNAGAFVNFILDTTNKSANGKWRIICVSFSFSKLRVIHFTVKQICTFSFFSFLCLMCFYSDTLSSFIIEYKHSCICVKWYFRHEDTKSSSPVSHGLGIQMGQTSECYFSVRLADRLAANLSI